MGMIGRLLIPRSARKAMNPISALGGAIMPRPVKQLRRATFAMTNPVGALGGAVEDLVVETLRPRRGGRRRTSTSAASHAGASRIAEMEECALDNAALQAVMELHREPGKPAIRALVAPWEAVDRGALAKKYGKEAVKGLRLWQRTERRQALQAARLEAEEDSRAEDERRERKQEQEQEQAELDATWEALCAHEPAVVVRVLTASFERTPFNVLASAAGAASATVLAEFPGIALVPDRALGTTPTGRPSLRKRSKTTRNELYADALASFTLAVARCAFNFLPGASTVSVVALRHLQSGFEHVDTSLIPIAHCELHRDDLSLLDEAAPATAVLEHLGGALKQKGRTKEVAEIRFDDPQLQELVDVFKLRRHQRKDSAITVSTRPGATIRFV